MKTLSQRPSWLALPATLALVFSFHLVGSPSAAAQARAVPETTIEDVGRIDDVNNVEVRFTIHNQGDSDLELVEVVAACGCTVVDFDEVIEPGSSGSVWVTLKPLGYSGALARSVRVYTNDAGNPYMDLVIKAMIAPSVYMVPGYARLVAIAGQEVEPVQQVIWAGDLDPFEVLSATTELDFVEIEVRPAEESERSPQGIGDQWLVGVRLSGTPPDSDFSDTIVIRTNHPTRPELRLPLFGQVRAPVHSVPATLQLGSHAVGSAIEAAVRLEATDREEQVVFGEARVEAGAAGTVETSYEEISDRLYLVVFFRDWPVGEVDTQIHVSTDHPEMPILSIPVTGAIVE